MAKRIPSAPRGSGNIAVQILAREHMPNTSEATVNGFLSPLKPHPKPDDAYISGVLYGLLSKEGDYQRALEYGNATSALKNTIPGDLLSTDLKEIDGIIREHKSTGRVAEMDR